MNNITVTQLRQMMHAGTDFQLIDVREEDEHLAFNIGGELMPLPQLMRYRDQIATNKPVVFYCRRGIRSQFAIQKLLRLFPYSNLYNLTGGTEAWNREV